MIKEVYIQRASAVHSLNFWVKFLCLLLVLPLASFISSPELLGFLVFTFILLLFLSKIGLRKFWRLSKLYLVGITTGVILLSALFSLGAWQERVILGLILALRFILLISFGLLFSAVTNPIEIPIGFLQAKIPHKFGITLMVGYRMMPLLTQKIQTIINAQKARGAKVGLSLKTLPHLPYVLVSLAVPVLHSTLEMSVRLSDALISRGYNPEGKITVPPGRIKSTDFVFFTVSLAILFFSLKI